MLEIFENGKDLKKGGFFVREYKVSCIVPVYNLEDRISKCVDSILSQTQNGIEIILVNDCSTDGSLNILHEYEERYSNIVVIDLKENLRQGGARNRGLYIAKGDYILFLDGDDWIDSHMIEELYAKAVKDDLDIVDSDYYQEGENGEVERKTSIPYKVLREYNKKSLIINCGRLWTKLIRKKLLIDNNLLFPEHRKFEDNPFLPIALTYTDKIGKVDQAFYHYRYNPVSTSRKKNDFSVFDRLETAKYLIDEANRRKLYMNYKEEYDFLFIQFFYANSIVACITKFDSLPVDKVIDIYDEINLIIPEYRSNRYIAMAPKYIKVLTRVHKYTLIFICKIISALIHCGCEELIVRKAKIVRGGKNNI